MGVYWSYSPKLLPAMKNLLEQIEHTKTKPHHVRKRIVFGAATGITALIALVWFSISIGTGAFAIAGSSFADTEGKGNMVTAGVSNENKNLAGSAAALPAEDSANAPAHINIIDAVSSTSRQKAEPTIIPF